MSLHYITDEKGKTTGVFIPIEEWDNVESRYVETDENECEVQEWQKEIFASELVRPRLMNICRGMRFGDR